MTATTNTNTSTAIAKQQPQQGPTAVQRLNNFLAPRKNALQTYGASNPDRMVQVALLEFSTRDDLNKCTPESIYTALAISAQLGLIPSSALGEAFLVPFKGKCTLIPGWKGFVKLAHRSNAIRTLTSDVVYERDEFDIELGTKRQVFHKPALKNRGEIIGAVAIAVLATGETDIEWMPIEDLWKIREAAERSRPSAAYRDWEDQMYRKAPLRRLCKRLPLGDDYAKAAAVDDLVESGQPHRVREVLDVPEQLEQPAERPPQAQQLAGAVAARAAAVRGQTTIPVDTTVDAIDVGGPVLEEPSMGPPTPAELVELFATCADQDTLQHLVGVRAELGPTLGDEDRALVLQAEKDAAARISKAKKK